MQFRSKLSLDVFDAECVNEGYTVPNIEDGKTLETKTSQRGDRIVIGLRCGKLSNVLSPVFLRCVMREVSASSKDGKRVSKTLDCRSYPQIIRQCDIDEEIKDFIDARTGRAFIKESIENVLPAFKVQRDLFDVRERRTVSRGRTSWRSWGSWRRRRLWTNRGRAANNAGNFLVILATEPLFRQTLSDTVDVLKLQGDLDVSGIPTQEGVRQ
jgi:hypothetical protein